MIKNHKLTLEQRVARLENALKANRRCTRKFESDYSMSNLQASCDWLRAELRDWFPDAPVDAKVTNGKIYVDYGPDDIDLYLKFQIVPERRGYSVSSSEGLTSNAKSIGDTFDMIVEAIQGAQAWA